MSTLRSIALEWGQSEVITSRPARRVIGVAAFAVATALSAKIALPIPGTPVPFTFQPLLVMLAGVLLGARLGAASQLLYLAAGAVGFPVFAAGGGVAYLLGPTGGYLLAYPAAAWVGGAVVRPGAGRALLAALAALGVIYAGGVSWLAVIAGPEAALGAGLWPFLLADLVKALLVCLVAVRARSRALELFGA